MFLSSINFNVLNKSSLNPSYKKNKINFTSNADVIEFSTIAKEKNALKKSLVEIGFSEQETKQIIKEFYGTDEYKKLTQGEYDEFSDKILAAHCLGFERNLNPQEALVYQYFDMDGYYMQHEPFSSLPNDAQSTYATNVVLGCADFSPVELAKTILETKTDIVLSGLILKGEIIPAEAQKVLKYYSESSDFYNNAKNVANAQSDIAFVRENLDTLEMLTSQAKDDNGAYVSGLKRPLNPKEARIVVAQNLDVDTINSHLEVKEEETKKIKLKQKMHFETLSEKLDYCKQQAPQDCRFVLEILKGLDDDKFKQRLYTRYLMQDLILLSIQKSELLEENVKAMNGMSEELLDKISTGKKLTSLPVLLTVPNLAQKVEDMNNFATEGAELFAVLPKERILDYLADSTMFSDLEQEARMICDTVLSSDFDCAYSYELINALLDKKEQDLKTQETKPKILPFSSGNNN